MIKLPKIDSASNIAGKKVFVRGDIDVPLKNEGDSGQARMTIEDDTRLKGIWPTIEFLLKQNCQVILAGHLGRPEGKVDPGLSSKPVAQWMFDYLKQNTISNFKFLISNQIQNEQISNYQSFRVGEQLTVLENLRFDPREEANDPDFGRQLAGLADVYVNESFAVSERAHASVVQIPKFLPHFAGFRLAKEIGVLSEVLENPVRPLVVVIGGAKLETKIPLISKMESVADCVIVGGKLLSEIKVGSPIMGMVKVKILRLTENSKDTTLESIDRYGRILATAGTVVWNGPVGMVEDYSFQVGTRRLAELIGATKAKKIVGGGDTIGILDKLGLISKFDWVCSGGGSMLKFLAGEELPGVKALLS